MTTTPKTSEEMARDLRTQLEASGRYGPTDALDPHDGSVQRRVEEILAAAIREAEDRGRLDQVVRDLPEALDAIKERERGDILEAMVTRMIDDRVDQGLVTTEDSGAGGHCKIAAPKGSGLDENGVVRKMLGTLPMTADGAAVVPECDITLWCPINLSDRTCGYTEEHGMVRLYTDGEYSLSSNNRNQCWPVIQCYSTLELAEAARKDAK